MRRVRNTSDNGAPVRGVSRETPAPVPSSPVEYLDLIQPVDRDQIGAGQTGELDILEFAPAQSGNVRRGHGSSTRHVVYLVPARCEHFRR